MEQRTILVYEYEPPSSLKLRLANKTCVTETYAGTHGNLGEVLIWCEDRMPRSVLARVRHVQGTMHHFSVDELQHHHDLHMGDRVRQMIDELLAFVQESVQNDKHIKICCKHARYKSAVCAAIILMRTFWCNYDFIKLYLRRQWRYIDIRRHRAVLSQWSNELQGLRTRPLLALENRALIPLLR